MNTTATNNKSSFKIDDILGTHLDTSKRQNDFKTSNSLPNCCNFNGTNYHLTNLFSTLMHHKKCRRTRTVFSDAQLIGLEKRFESQKYLSTSDRLQLASSLGLSQLQVKTWYQNRRMKWKKQVMKEGHRQAPTKPKGRPKKNSIPSLSEILAAQGHNSLSTDNDSNYISDDLSSDNEDSSSCNYHDDDDDDDDSRIDVVGI